MTQREGSKFVLDTARSNPFQHVALLDVQLIGSRLRRQGKKSLQNTVRVTQRVQFSHLITYWDKTRRITLIGGPYHHGSASDDPSAVGWKWILTPQR